jgi:hypothetical protein
VYIVFTSFAVDSSMSAGPAMVIAARAAIVIPMMCSLSFVIAEFSVT